MLEEVFCACVVIFGTVTVFVTTYLISENKAGDDAETECAWFGWVLVSVGCCWSLIYVVTIVVLVLRGVTGRVNFCLSGLVVFLLMICCVVGMAMLVKWEILDVDCGDDGDEGAFWIYVCDLLLVVAVVVVKLSEMC
jgi:uncharacterized membrane-anchored protein